MKANYKRIQVTIQPGEQTTINRLASFVTCLAATGAFQVRIDGEPATDFEKGLTYTPPAGLQQVEIINTSGTALTVALGFGLGNIQDSRLSISGEINTSEAMPDNFTSGAVKVCPSGAVTPIALANPLRREIVLVSEGAAAVRVVGNAAAVAGDGLPLGAAQSLTLQTSAAVYVRNDSGASVNVAWAELEASL